MYKIEFILCKYSLFFAYVLCMCFYLYYNIHYGDVLLCDSGDNIHDCTQTEDCNTNLNEEDHGNLVPNPGLLYRIKCKIAWHISGKNVRLYNSYEDYKKSWGSQTVWSKIKSDFKLARVNKNRVYDNDHDASDLMRNIHNSRGQEDIARQMTRNKVNIDRSEVNTRR